MATISSTTGTISSAGIGSGLDVNSIVTQLMALEKQPLTALQTAASTMQTELSAFGQMQSLVSALQDAAQPLYDSTTFNQTSVVSSNASAVTATTATGAVPGVYSVSVSALASAQSLVGNASFTDATAAVGTGTLTIRLGTWNAAHTAFTPQTGSSDISVPIGASENTLAGIRDKINAANAGVTASVVTDASGARLALQSTSTGASNGFRVTVSDSDGGNTDASGLSRLAYDPASGAAQMTLAQSAANAQATVNGIAVSSADNTLEGVASNVTFTLNAVTTSAATVSVSRSSDGIKAKVAAFVSAYNDLNSYLSQATKYDPSTKTAALLQGDSTATSIQNQLHNQVGNKSGASAAFSTLSALGIELQKDGSLKLNDTKFADALTNPTELAKALGNLDPTVAANNGLAKRFADWAGGLLSSNGALPGKTKAIQDEIARNQKDQDSLSDRLDATEARLRAQYSALDTTMSKANALAKYVQQQFYFNSSFSSSGNNNSNNG